MDADVLSKAAAPFVTSKRDQHGLGLSAAVRVIEIHGGALKISSTLGVGTQVEISLPTASRRPTSRDPKAST
jgi:nitrogen-specific signal transduction histidine kinase